MQQPLQTTSVECSVSPAIHCAPISLTWDTLSQVEKGRTDNPRKLNEVFAYWKWGVGEIWKYF